MLYLNTILSGTYILIAFISYYFIINQEVIKGYFIKKAGDRPGQIRMILFQRLTGILLFGILPLTIFFIRNNSSLIESVLKIHFNLTSLIIVMVFVLISFCINYFAARSPDNLIMYPQIRCKTWSFSLLVISGLSWMTYLLAYELTFRGFLLFSSIKEFNPFIAIVLNICLYSIVHIPKGIKESIGAIPMGLILCILTIHSGTIWMAFWIHCSMALSNEWLSIKYHPEMKILIHKE
jgi:membrane protease YdiL (CAAX protease family)